MKSKNEIIGIVKREPFWDGGSMNYESSSLEYEGLDRLLPDKKDLKKSKFDELFDEDKKKNWGVDDGE